MQGLADDGGLFMPDYWPQIDLDEIKSQKSFVGVAKCVVPLFTSSSFSHQVHMIFSSFLVPAKKDVFFCHGFVIIFLSFSHDFLIGF